MPISRRTLLSAAAFSGTPCCARSHPDRFSWSELPSLPLAVSGHFAGVSDGALIVAGGAYFPKSLFEGGKKVWTDQVAVLERGATSWLTGYYLDEARAYGASVSSAEGLICIGGGNATHHNPWVYRLRWRERQLVREELAPLPKASAFHSAAVLNHILYVAGGQEGPDSLARGSFWGMDLSRPFSHWVTLGTWPGPARILPALSAQNGSLYLMGGCSLHLGADGKPVRTYLQDAYRFTPGAAWTPVPEVPRPLTAAPTAPWGRTRVLILGGDDGENAHRVQELKDRHPGFCRDVLSYDTEDRSWKQVASLPIGMVTTNAVRWSGKLVIPGGEDRPGHRTTQAIACRLPG